MTTRTGTKSVTTAEPFPDLIRAREADRLGMLLFLASEVMLFGGLFAAALGLRLAHPLDYAHASMQLHVWLGGLNTAVLLTSSLLVALAVEATRAGRPRAAAWQLIAAALLGAVFATVKGLEYWLEWRDGIMPGVNGSGFENHVQELFMDLYFVATGLHAVHLTIGVVMLLALAVLAGARRDRQATVVGNVALYWHLVDIVWVFLYPTLYLARP